MIIVSANNACWKTLGCQKILSEDNNSWEHWNIRKSIKLATQWLGGNPTRTLKGWNQIIARVLGSKETMSHQYQGIQNSPKENSTKYIQVI